MDIQAAEEQVKAWAEANSRSIGLNGANIKANYIWNPGGFTNQSYRISDGVTARHVKFAPEHKAASLKQWARISGHLTANYYAPRLIEEVAQAIVPHCSYGLVFDFVKGQPLNANADPAAVIEKVLHTLKQLHSDNVISGLIANEAKPVSYSAAFTETYLTRFEEDMKLIREGKHHLLHFVTASSLDWFDAEIGALRRLVSRMPSFQQEASEVVHNDMNWANVLSDGPDFWIIDWDDLSANGDAAMDYSVFLWPLYRSNDWPYWRDRIIGMTDGETFERMEVYFRAKLLDDVIDVLADYVEAEDMPEVKERTQRRAKEIHLRAYSEYLRLYAT